MSDIAIRVENLSKRYRIGLKDELHDTLVGALTDFIRRPVKNLRRLRMLSRFDDPDAADIIWALKDVSFEVKRGEVLGIIGRNGAGKSTLLKILARITHPTSGYVELHGRISSLLEVGTGFHQELTGRENIYLNGTILGMTRKEIDRKFDEIVDFSGVEKFIDTPVKRYSSGMRVRLAFSVAAHLEPEILLIDEVLAVGDVDFQKKSLGKMDQVAREGRTVLFVSHNMVMIQHLTNQVIYLDDGRIIGIGPTEEVVAKYLSQYIPVVADAHVDLSKTKPTILKQTPVLKSLRVLSHGKPATSIRVGDPIEFCIEYSVPDRVEAPLFGVSITTEKGERIVSFGMYTSRINIPEIIGDGSVICAIDSLPLNQGTYYLSISLNRLREGVLESYDQVCKFNILPGDFLNTGRIPDPKWGIIVIPAKWIVENIPTR